MKRNISSLVRMRLIDLAILARQGRAVVKKNKLLTVENVSQMPRSISDRYI